MRISNRNINGIYEYSTDGLKDTRAYEKNNRAVGEEEASLSISYESRELLKKNKVGEDRNKVNEEGYRRLKEMFDQLNKANEASDDQLSILSKCMKIAMRIIQGDYVPEQDEKFLIENNPKLYSTAVNFRRLKEDPEKWDSVLEDEKEEVDFNQRMNDALEISESQIDME